MEAIQEASTVRRAQAGVELDSASEHSAVRPVEPVYLLFTDMDMLDGDHAACGVMVPRQQAWKALERARRSRTIRNARLIEISDVVREVTADPSV